MKDEEFEEVCRLLGLSAKRVTAFFESDEFRDAIRRAQGSMGYFAYLVKNLNLGERPNPFESRRVATVERNR